VSGFPPEKWDALGLPRPGAAASAGQPAPAPRVEDLPAEALPELSQEERIELLEEFVSAQEVAKDLGFEIDSSDPAASSGRLGDLRVTFASAGDGRCVGEDGTEYDVVSLAEAAQGVRYSEALDHLATLYHPVTQGRERELRVEKAKREGFASATNSRGANALPGAASGRALSGKGKKKKAADDKPTHAELRDRFLSAGTQYGYGLGAWRSYEDGIWVEEDERVVENQVSLVVDDAQAEGIRPTDSINRSVARMALVRVAVPDKKWNADPDILVAQNGALHIPTQTLQPHHPEHYATSKVPYDYDASARAPKWEKYMTGRFSDEVAAFLQEFAGYCLTTDVSHEIAVWLYGPPGGGRSTFILGMETMLGEKVGVLGLREIERNDFALADVPGKTLLTATEQPGGYTSVTDIVNAMISGDSVMINQKYTKAYRVHPQAKILWSMNHLPQIQNPEDGLFRRIHVVEMEKIEEDKKDTTMKAAIQTEGAGILNWALAGLERLLARRRFEAPEEVRNATAEYKATQDVPAVFVSDMCVTGKDLTEQSSRLYKAYEKWCHLNGHKAKSSTAISSDWKRLGFEKYPTGGVRRYKDVALRMDAYAELGIDDA
jgi:P4 family phage/plasmid primase-like protien